MGHKALAKLVSLLIKRNQRNNQSQIKVGGMWSNFFFCFHFMVCELLSWPEGWFSIQMFNRGALDMGPTESHLHVINCKNGPESPHKPARSSLVCNEQQLIKRNYPQVQHYDSRRCSIAQGDVNIHKHELLLHSCAKISPSQPCFQ